MGRPAKPLSVHKVHGTFRADRHSFAPEVPTSMPDCPEYLDGTARGEWDRITAEMLAAGTLARIDRTILAAHCQTYARWVHAEEQIKLTGTLIKTQAGEARISPWVKVAHDALSLLRNYSIDLGLSPAARTKLRGITPASNLSAKEMRFFEHVKGRIA